MIDFTSTPALLDINLRIAAHVSALRAQRGLSLDALAKHSGVSRSTISLIERGQTSPTAVVLDKLAIALGVTLAALFEDATSPSSPLVRRADQSTWTDPQSGYSRRNISPPQFRSSLQIVEIDFPAGATVTYEAGRRDVDIQQQVWVLEGCMEFMIDNSHYRLEAGDCLAMRENGRIVFQNTTTLPARYVVVTHTGFLTT